MKKSVALVLPLSFVLLGAGQAYAEKLSIDTALCEYFDLAIVFNLSDEFDDELIETGDCKVLKWGTEYKVLKKKGAALHIQTKLTERKGWIIEMSNLLDKKCFQDFKPLISERVDDLYRY